MKSFRRLRQAFLIVAGSMTMTMTAGGYAPEMAMADNTSFIDKEKTISTEDNIQTAQFDYAFGDQTAASLGLPGATQKDWGVRDSFHGFKEFIEKNPNALKGKNVFVAIGNGGAIETFLVGPKFAKRMIEAVGHGHVVLLGLSEDRTDMNGASANNLIKKQLEGYGAIYGGPMIRASTPQKVYPRTQAEFDANHNQALAILRAHVNKTALKNKHKPVFNKS